MKIAPKEIAVIIALVAFVGIKAAKYINKYLDRTHEKTVAASEQLLNELSNSKSGLDQIPLYRSTYQGFYFPKNDAEMDKNGRIEVTVIEEESFNKLDCNSRITSSAMRMSYVPNDRKKSSTHFDIGMLEAETFDGKSYVEQTTSHEGTAINRIRLTQRGFVEEAQTETSTELSEKRVISKPILFTTGERKLWNLAIKNRVRNIQYDRYSSDSDDGSDAVSATLSPYEAKPETIWKIELSAKAHEAGILKSITETYRIKPDGQIVHIEIDNAEGKMELKLITAEPLLINCLGRRHASSVDETEK